MMDRSGRSDHLSAKQQGLCFVSNKSPDARRVEYYKNMSFTPSARDETQQHCAISGVATTELGLKSTHGGDYLLTHDEAETIQLNAQRHALTARQGWRLHPKIQQAIARLEKLRIADVACGTGIWMFEVAEEFHTARVTGLDITADQFPPQWTRSTTSRLDTLDLSGQVPSKHRGNFDVVHCQFYCWQAQWSTPGCLSMLSAYYSSLTAVYSGENFLVCG